MSVADPSEGLDENVNSPFDLERKTQARDVAAIAGRVSLLGMDAMVETATRSGKDEGGGIISPLAAIPSS